VGDSEAYQWLDRARADLRVATGILQPDWDCLAVAPFLMPQAAEKSLKGLQRSRGLRIPRTHNLVKLRALLGDGEIAELLKEVEASTDFATVFRYPGDEDEPRLEEAQDALAMVHQLYAAILERIPEELRPAKRA
jgi:HEPN domain-containing protein